MPTPDSAAAVRTTQTSIDLLTAVRDHDGARLREIAEAMGLARSTVHKHLSTLERNGFVRKEGEIYHVGLRFLHFGEYARNRWPGFPHIKDAVVELTERTDEEIDFVAEDRGRVTTIEESYHRWAKYDDRSGGTASKEYRAHIGDYYYMHATAAGLAILAAYPVERVLEIVDRWGLPAKTDHTITSRGELFATLERVRERGYSVNDQGYTEGMRSLGRVVTGPDGSVLGAFSVSGPTYRIDGAVLEQEIPKALREVVESLEERLAAEWSA